MGARWTGYIMNDRSETVTFRVYHDDWFWLNVRGSTMGHNSSGDWDYMSVYMYAN